MLLTINWIKDFLETNCSSKEIIGTLNEIGFETEIIEDRQERLKNFTIAKIVETKIHPEIPKLKICKVQIDKNNEKNLLTVICGASNAKANINTVFAPIGSIIPCSGILIEKRQFQEVNSEGMLCSAAELGIFNQDNKKIIEIDNKIEIGTKLTDHYGLGDIVIQSDITPNRGDCFGVYGIARELCAKGIGTLTKVFNHKNFTIQQIKQNCLSLFKTDANMLDISITDPNLVHYLSLYKISNITNIKPEIWIKQRLTDAKIKIFDNILDIASFVSHSFGQPLHIYDANKISKQIFIGSLEKIKSLHKLKNYQIKPIGEERLYNAYDTDIVHVMDNEIINLSGIIGGDKTKFHDETNDILLECAEFNSDAIAQTGQRLLIDTDARKRFERGIDSSLTTTAALMLIKMLKEINQNAKAIKLVEINNFSTSKNAIEFQLKDYEKLIGQKISEEKIKTILEKLGFIVDVQKTEKQDIKYSIIPPIWRRDIINKNDVAQEILRIDGYDNVKPIPIKENFVSCYSDTTENLKNQIRTIMSFQGYNEVYSYAFVNKTGLIFKNSDQEKIEIINPISDQMSYMRNSIIPGLIEIAYKNQCRNCEVIPIFEIGPIFNNTNINYTNGAKKAECLTLGMLKNAAKKSVKLHDQIDKTDFFEIKHVIETIFNGIAINKKDISYSNKDIPEFLHPKNSAVITIKQNLIGFTGELHPKISKLYSLKNNTIVSQINLSNIINYYKNIPKKEAKYEYFYPSSYQKVNRDFCFVVDVKTNIGDAINSIYDIENTIIKNVNIFDIFISDKLPEGKKSFSIHVTMQSDTGTLSSDSIKSIENKIINLMFNTLKAELRI